jgi:hypothetical protein
MEGNNTTDTIYARKIYVAVYKLVSLLAIIQSSSDVYWYLFLRCGCQLVKESLDHRRKSGTINQQIALYGYLTEIYIFVMLLITPV